MKLLLKYRKYNLRSRAWLIFLKVGVHSSVNLMIMLQKNQRVPQAIDLSANPMIHIRVNRGRLKLLKRMIAQTMYIKEVMKMGRD